VCVCRGVSSICCENMGNGMTSSSGIWTQGHGERTNCQVTERTTASGKQVKRESLALKFCLTSNSFFWWFTKGFLALFTSVAQFPSIEIHVVLCGEKWMCWFATCSLQQLCGGGTLLYKWTDKRNSKSVTATNSEILKLLLWTVQKIPYIQW